MTASTTESTTLQTLPASASVDNVCAALDADGGVILRSDDRAVCVADVAVALP